MPFFEHCSLQLVGASVVAYYGFRVLRFSARLFNESLCSKTLDFKKHGDWVVITGGSDGIGKALAFEFAKCGMNVCILARTKSKLENVEQSLRSEFDVEVKTVAVDFCAEDVYDKIANEIDGMNVAVLVNNVGMTFLDPCAFLDVPNHRNFSSDLTNVNVNALMKLTSIVLPNMVRRNRGVVVNISSVIGKRITPFFAVYGSGKSLMINFTEALRQEYSSSGVLFQCVAPGIVATPPIAATMKSNFIVPTPELYAKYAIKAIGKSSYTNTGFVWHNVFQWILTSMPDAAFFRVMKNGADEAMSKRSR